MATPRGIIANMQFRIIIGYNVKVQRIIKTVKQPEYSVIIMVNHLTDTELKCSDF